MVIDWHFYNVQKRKIDDVLLEHVGLLYPITYVLPLTVLLEHPLVLVLRLRVWSQGLTFFDNCAGEITLGHSAAS